MFWLGWLLLINMFLLITIALRESRRSNLAFTWIVISMILPIIGFLLYLSASRPNELKSLKQDVENKEFIPMSSSFKRSTTTMIKALHSISLGGLKKGKVQLLMNGIQTYEHLIQSIEKAQKNIDFEYYIYRHDHIGKTILDLLIERSLSGVKVRFMVDGWGSRKLTKSVVDKMKNAGIEYRVFFPMKFPSLFKNWNYRNHCKIVILDEDQAYTGGINIGDENSGKKPDVGYWRDTHILIEGEPAKDLLSIFNFHWNLASKATQSLRKKNMDKEKAKVMTNISKNSLKEWSTEWAVELGSIDATHLNQNQLNGNQVEAYIQTIEGNPSIATQAIREAFFQCITQAEHSVDISTPYFLPDVDIMMAIKAAVARGVFVRLLVPSKTDSILVELASYTFYGELLDVGVEIYQYTKGFMHAKQMVVDGEVVVIGAANYDIRSFRLNIEVCEVLYSSELASQLLGQFEEDIQCSKILQKEELIKRSTFERIQEQGARILLPLL